MVPCSPLRLLPWSNWSSRLCLLTNQASSTHTHTHTHTIPLPLSLSVLSPHYSASKPYIAAASSGSIFTSFAYKMISTSLISWSILLVRGLERRPRIGGCVRRGIIDFASLSTFINTPRPGVPYQWGLGERGGGGNRIQMLSQGISLEIHAISQAADLTLPIIIMNINKLMKLDKLV